MKNYKLKFFLRHIYVSLGLAIFIALINQFAFAAASPVTWINPVNVTVTGNNIAKNGGCDGCADSGANSQQQITSGNGYVEFTATASSKGIIGLGNTVTNSTGYTEINYLINFSSVNNTWEIRELNWIYKTDGTYTTGDIFRIAVESGAVKYYKNGVVIYTSTVTPSYPLVADTSLLPLTGKIDNVMIENGSSSGVCTPNVKSDMLTYLEPALPSIPSLAGGKFCDPTFGTEIMRVTDSSTLNYGGSEYAIVPTFNSNNTKILVFEDSSGGFVLDFDPNTFTLTGNKRTLPTSVNASFAQWSNNEPNILYTVSSQCSTSKLWKIDVTNSTTIQTPILVKDFSALSNFAAGDYFVRMSSSADDDVFAMTHKTNCGTNKGFVVYKKSTDQILYNDPNPIFDGISYEKCQIDKSGRFMTIGGYAGTQGYDTYVKDLFTGTMTPLKDGAPDYSPGHGDFGNRMVVADDNFNNRLLFRSLLTPNSFSTVLNIPDWTIGYHYSLRGSSDDWGLLSTYDGGCNPQVGPLHRELALIKNDGSQSVKRIAHPRTTSINSDCTFNYAYAPHANLSRDGKFVAFRSNWEKTLGTYTVGASTYYRTDLFIVKIPTGTIPALPNNPSNLTAAVVSSSQINLTWADNSSDETGFKVERSADNNTFTEIATTAANAMAYSSTGLSANTTYYYRIRATNANGNSNYSNVISATTQQSSPTAPTNLIGIVMSTTSIKLDWTDSSINETNFLVQRCSGVTCTAFVTIASGTLVPNTVTLTNTGLTNGTVYRYRIGATNSFGTNYSNIITVTSGIPAVPTGLTAAVISNSQINLSWTDASNNETGFKIERCTGQTCTNYAQIATTTVNSATFNNTGLAANTYYRYRVLAYNTAGNSAYTTVITARTNP
jgi:hypothetical protein